MKELSKALTWDSYHPFHDYISHKRKIKVQNMVRYNYIEK